ncbi:phosphoribosylglycinamide formyltransferase [Aquisalimonas asiatica]|uniref:Phosphoribosylglycinamide formyltransferase n=1 Tax=Aquisalimonas asiatica TaxID=406100 RepID=A0A1H8RMH6_9GAMM|nr:phosphoribosylglycinamide formyltransferase [Aquisalimonas asiatica]SEO67388.1 phosphoribosylglycinamide formyltransferase-1 [Aquisalimonas asiatica]
MTVTTPSLVVLISGSGSNLQALIDAREAGDLPADIRAVISNRPDAYGLERARAAGIHTEVLDHRDFAGRTAYDTALQQRIDAHAPELVVLAGFMRILTDELVNHFRGRMLNIHPSLLPAFRGLHTHSRALEAGHSEHGCSVHFVTPALDAGPVIAQGVVPIEADDSEPVLARRVRQQEHRIYPLVVRWFAQGRLQLDGDTAVLDGQPLEEPVRLRAADPVPS